MPRLAIALLLALLPSAAAPAADLSALAGSWVLVDGEAEEKACHEAVERTVESMAVYMRPFARKRMHKAIRVIPSHRFELQGDALSWAAGGGSAQALPLDGKPRKEVVNGGDEITTTVTVLPGGGLRSQWVRDDSDGYMEFRISADGQTLTVERMINSKYFGEPVRFTNRYRRG